MTNTGVCTLLLAMSLGTACAPQKKFGAAVPEANAVKEEVKKPVVDSGNSATPIQPIETKIDAPKCDEDSVGLTSAKILSSALKVKTSGQTVKYELALINCKDGSIVPLKDQRILFDINARSATQDYKDVSYSVSDAGSKKQIAKGVLQIKEGSDLFGNVGKYAHWRTDLLSYDTSVEKLILEINFGSASFNTAKDGDDIIASYLRIGEAKPVKQDLEVIQ